MLTATRFSLHIGPSFHEGIFLYRRLRIPYSLRLLPKTMKPEDLKEVPSNYVSHILETEAPLPPVQWKNLHKELYYLGCSVILIPPIIGIYGALHTPLRRETFWFGLFWMHVIGTGSQLVLTSSYQRLTQNASIDGWVPSLLGP